MSAQHIRLTCIQPDGTVNVYDLYTITELNDMLRHKPVAAAELLARMGTLDLRIVARACQRLHQWRHDQLRRELRWWESVIGPDQPEPEPELPDRGLFEDD